MQQESVWLSSHGVLDFRPEANQCFHAREYVHTHSKVNDDQVRIRREVNCLAGRFHIFSCRHEITSVSGEICRYRSDQVSLLVIAWKTLFWALHPKAIACA